MSVSRESAVKHAASFDGSLTAILVHLSNAQTLESFQAGQIFLNACLNASHRELLKQEQEKCLKGSLQATQ